jgi:anti-sigma B factor antagonist
MAIRERQIGDVSIVEVEGRITIQDGADAFRRALQAHIQAGDVKLVVNLGNVPYIDTTGLSEIVRGYTSAMRRNGALKLVQLTPHVRQVLAVTKLLTIFEVYDDEAAALKSFSGATV